MYVRLDVRWCDVAIWSSWVYATKNRTFTNNFKMHIPSIYRTLTVVYGIVCNVCVKLLTNDLI